jgi:hypothetical protein
MFEKKFAKKVRTYYKLSEGRGGEGREGGELSFQCLRPLTSLMAAGKNMTNKWISLRKSLETIWTKVRKLGKTRIEHKPDLQLELDPGYHNHKEWIMGDQ